MSQQNMTGMSQRKENQVWDLQQFINIPSLNSFQQSSDIAPTWRRLVLINVMQPLHWPVSSLL